jgi:hypothetical protein
MGHAFVTCRRAKGCRAWALLCGLALAPVPSADAAAAFFVIFRYDDFSANTDAAFERRLFDALERRGLPLTVAVIPAVARGDYHDPGPQESLPLPAAKVELLVRGASRGLLDPVLHGLTHQTRRALAEGSYTEFEGLRYEEQLDRIRLARATLEAALGAPVRTFVPPWETYDAGTLKALEAVGIDTISAQGWGVGEGRTKLGFVPSTSSLLEAREAILSARESGDEAPIVVILFHAFDFEETNSARAWLSLADFESLLDWVKEQRDLTVTTVSGVARLGGVDSTRAIGFERLRAPQQLLPVVTLRPLYLPDLESLGPLAVRAWVVVVSFYVLVIGVAMVAATAAARRMFSRWPGSRVPAAWSALLVTASLAYVALRDGNLGFKAALPLAVLLGGTAALWLARVRPAPGATTR